MQIRDAVEEVHENLALWYSADADGDIIVVRSQDGDAVATLVLNGGDVLPEDTNVNIVQAIGTLACYPPDTLHIFIGRVLTLYDRIPSFQCCF